MNYSPKINALFIIWSLEKGGAERFWVELLKHIDHKKIRPVVCCLNWKGAWAKELEEKGIQVIELNKKDGIDIKAFINLVKIIKREKFLIVNTCLWGADVTGRLAAFVAGVPIVISTVQNVDEWKKWWHKAIDRLLSRRTKMFIAVSEAVKEYYHRDIGIPLSKITVIPNAIEVEKFENVGDITYLYDELDVTPEDFTLACIGRLTEQKGQKYLLESLGILRPKYPHLKVLFVGDGEEKDKLMSLAQRLNVNDMVRFLGHHKDIPQILHLSDGLVLPSLYEGLPLCVLEAMASSKPVIATNVGGSSDLVIDGETGFMVSPQNIEALAQAIKNLINLSDKGAEMGKKGREIVIKNFSIQSIAKKTNNLFLSLGKEEL